MMGEPATDAALIAASTRGQRGAFRQIVERYQAMVCAVAYSVLGDLAASEDAAQETFVAAWGDLHTLREPDKLRAWLAGVARNTARSAARRRQRDVVRRAEPLSDHLAQDAAAPAELAARREEEQLLWQVLEQVPEVYREPLVLYHREHQSIAEVAETMGISEDAVKQRLARGRQALKEQVATFVESALRRTGPSAAFSAGVLAALNSTAGKAGAAAVASGGAAGGALTGAALGVLGGILGSLIGVAGGVFGTWCSIRAAKPGEERSFMVVASVACWIWTTLLVSVYLYIAFREQPLFQNVWFQVGFWMLHGVALTAGIIWANRRQAEIRAREPRPPE